MQGLSTYMGHVNRHGPLAEILAGECGEAWGHVLPGRLLLPKRPRYIPH